MKAGTAWLWGPWVFLGATVLFGGWRVALALDDPHFAAVEHPYEDGEQWDQHQQRVAARDAMKWQAELQPAADGSLELRLRDADGKPVDGLQGTLSGYHNGYPRDVQTQALTALGEGRYRAAVAIGRTGLWKWHLSVEDSAYFQDFKLHLTAGGAP